MDLSEIAIAFRDCNAETNNLSFKDYKTSLKDKGIDTTTGVIVNDANNFILYDCEKLLTKSIINIIGSNLLLSHGLFNWAFVSSYYSSFYSIQALNRLQLNFTGFDIKCELVNYANKEIKLTKYSTSSSSHEEQFHIFYNHNAGEYKKNRVDREWNIGLGTFDDLGGYNSESSLRNAINYYISKSDDFYYEFSLEDDNYNKIIKDNLISPFKEKERYLIPPNFARRAFKIAIARIRVHAYILNYIANYNKEYKSYYQRNMSTRMNAVDQRYSFISPWLLSHLQSWLKFENIILEEVEPI